MIDYTYKDLYYQDSVDKQLKIEVEDGTVITNEDIFSESMTLTESLCSDTNLSFGSCEASKFEIKIANQFYSMKGMWLTVSEVLNGHENEPFVFGKYKVESDRPTADRSFREIVAYDALYDIINADVTDVAEWYETLLPELDSTVTLKEFRDSFFAHFDIEQEEVELPNDDMIVEKTISSASLSGKEVVTAICEINGCFGHIGRDNKFHYIFLPEISDGNAYALAVDDDTFLVTPTRNASTSAILGHAVLGDAILGDDSVPSKTAVLGYATLGRAVLANEDEPPEEHDFGIGAPFTEGAKQATVIEKENWQYIDYEDYVTETISSLQIRDNTSEAGYTYDLGSGGNNYIIDGNFLVYGKDKDETHNIAKNIYEKISCVSYRPTDATLRGNPCFEVGDPIQLNSKYQVIDTYIIKRTLSGIQALKDNYESTGDETYDNAYNSISYEVEQLKGYSNTFERSIEQNTLEIKSIEGEVSTINQTINSISFNVTGGLGGTAYITMKVGNEAITGDIDLSDVREAFAEENSSIQIAAGVITFASNTLIVDSDNFQLTAAGKITATSGTIGGWTLTGTKIYGGGTIENGGDGNYEKVAAIQIPRDGITWVFAAGGEYHDSYSDCPFRVDKNGNMYAESGLVGGWYITSTRIKSSNSSDLKINGDEPGLLLINEDDKPFLDAEDGSGSSTLRINRDGSATFAGTLSGATGSFNGDVSATSFSLNGASFRISNQSLSYSVYQFVEGDLEDDEGLYHYNNTWKWTAVTLETSYGLYVEGSLASESIVSKGDLSVGGEIECNNIGAHRMGAQRFYAFTAGSGFIVENTTSGTNTRVFLSSAWSEIQISLQIGTGGYNRGIFDETVYETGSGGWIIYKNSSGNVVTNSALVTVSAQDDSEISSYNDTSASTELKQEEFIEKLKSHTYKHENKLHIGFTVSEVETAMKEAGLSVEDYAITDHFKDDDGNDVVGICYEEIIPILVHEIQELKQKISSIA